MEITRWPRLTRAAVPTFFPNAHRMPWKHGLHRHPSPACFHGARGGEGVDAEGIALCAGLLTDGGVGNDTSGFRSGVANLNVVIGAKFEDDLELARLRSTSVSDMILVDTVVGHTTDVLSAGVGWAFQAAVHHSGFTCHRYASKHPCDRCSLYDISAPFVHALGGAFRP